MLEQTLAEREAPPLLEHIDGYVKDRVSVILPAFNEEDHISTTIFKVKEMFERVCPDYEIIVVDDGSRDGTATIVEALGQKRVKLIGYPRNQGKGYALKKGLYHATGELAFTIDSDMEVWPRELRKYLEALNTADIVIGSKRHPLSRVRTPVMRRFLSLGFNMLEKLLTGVHASDTQAGVKAARSRALYAILPLLAVKRYAFDAELLSVATLFGLRIEELPVDIDLKASFRPTQVMRMLLDLLGIAYRLRIKRWYQRNYILTKNTYSPILSFENHNGSF